MKIDRNNKFFVIIILIIFILIVFSKKTIAQEIRASEYEINLQIEEPGTIVSEKIIISRKESEKASKESIFIEPFSLKNGQGETIPENLINVITPRGNFDPSSYNNFLLMAGSEASSWIQIELTPEAANLRPGKYQGNIYLNGIDLEINLSITVKPFLKIFIKDNQIEINIDRPKNGKIYLADEMIELIISTNHSNWEITSMIMDEALTLTNTDNTAVIQQQNILYNIKTSRLGRDIELNEDDFTPLSIEGEKIIMTGNDLVGDNIEIQIAVQLDSNWLEQIAGKYFGEIIFTIRELEY